MDERTLADALVSVVCHCGKRGAHKRGFPECHTARSAALIVLAMLRRRGVSQSNPNRTQTEPRRNGTTRMNPITLELTLDLDKFVSRYHGLSRDPEADVEMPPAAVEDVIIELAARMLADRSASDDAIKALLGETRKRVNTLISTEAVDQIRPMIERLIHEPIYKTNTFGGQIGNATTLAEVIVDEAKKFMTSKADRPGFGARGGQGLTMFQNLIAEEVEKVMTKELRDVIAEAKVQAKAAVAEQAGKIIAEAMERR